MVWAGKRGDGFQASGKWGVITGVSVHGETSHAFEAGDGRGNPVPLGQPQAVLSQQDDARQQFAEQ